MKVPPRVPPAKARLLYSPGFAAELGQNLIALSMLLVAVESTPALRERAASHETFPRAVQEAAVAALVVLVALDERLR